MNFYDNGEYFNTFSGWSKQQTIQTIMCKIMVAYETKSRNATIRKKEIKFNGFEAKHNACRPSLVCAVCAFVHSLDSYMRFIAARITQSNWVIKSIIQLERSPSQNSRDSFKRMENLFDGLPQVWRIPVDDSTEMVYIDLWGSLFYHKIKFTFISSSKELIRLPSNMTENSNANRRVRLFKHIILNYASQWQNDTCMDL